MSLYLYYIYIFSFFFENEEWKLKYKNIEEPGELFSFIYLFFIDNDEIKDEKELNSFIDYFIHLNSLNNTIEFYYRFITLLYIYKSFKKLNFLDKNCESSKYREKCEKLLTDLEYLLKENYAWLMYGQNPNAKEPEQKYKEIFFEGKKFQNEKLSLNVFEIINKTKNNIKMNGYIYQSVFKNNKIIIIEINLIIILIIKQQKNNSTMI